MGQKMFIPVTDEILYERPELITSPLMPFQVDHPCFRWLSAETEAVDPMTVDIDTSVELKITAAGLNFAPVDANHAGHSSHSPKSEAIIPDDNNHSYQHVLRKRLVLPCKDAA